MSKEQPDWSAKKVFTTGEAAQVCKVSQQTIIRCFDSGRLNGFRVPGSKFRRIPREELMRFMKTNDIPLEVLGSPLKRVLVVDDDPQIGSLLEDVFNDDGRFEVRVVGTGYDAGLETERFRPHLIVLDYMLPDINGDLVCRRIREREELNETRVLFVSGVIEASEVEGLMESGADGFMQKPFDLREAYMLSSTADDTAILAPNNTTWQSTKTTRAHRDTPTCANTSTHTNNNTLISVHIMNHDTAHAPNSS